MAKKPDATSNIGDTEAKLNSLQAAFKEDDLTKPQSLAPVPYKDLLKTPSMSINLMTGEGGIRPGSVVHWFGPFSTLKSWIAAEMCREAQEQIPDKLVAYLDVEYRQSPAVMAGIGVAFEPFKETEYPRCIYRKPESAEKTWDYARRLALSGAFSIIIVDSMPAMIPQKRLESTDVDNGEVSGAARLTSSMLPIVAQACEHTGTILWLINQLRIISIRPVTKKGAPGGNALDFYPTHTFKAERIEKSRGMESTALHILSEKMKYGLPMRECEVPILLGHGINREADLLHHAVRHDLVEKSGAWYYYQGDKLGQGEDNAATSLRERPEVIHLLTESILDAEGIKR